MWTSLISRITNYEVPPILYQLFCVFFISCVVPAGHIVKISVYLYELSARSGQLVMVARITDVLNRETALASSLNPVNPWASKGEKQFKATGMTRVALPCLLSRPRPRARTSQRLLVDAVRVSIHLTPIDARQPWFASSPRRALPPCPQAP